MNEAKKMKAPFIINDKDSQKILLCGDCGVDLSFSFGHYILKGHLLCGFCRSQYDQKGFSKTRGQLSEAKDGS